MEGRYAELLRTKCGREGYQKLGELNNVKLHDFIGKYVEHCSPASIFVRTDSAEDAQYIRDKAIENGEEKKLALQGHTVHFDGYYDQARDKDKTRLLLPSNVDLGSSINSMDR
ncbi:MAG TPA: phosphoenolpyruvate carboxykinase (GTP), partial [Candidatus Aerophobetes bacterium]|nr:phosphoenolpyruvate carboxykinase (GTP) [Candidatus Aerophobetes bacterium]